MGLKVAVKAFLKALTDESAAERIEAAFCESATTPPVEEEMAVRASCGRSEAVELLAALQRDARFVDFVKEDLASCDDATLGSVARSVQKGCAETLERFFEIRPMASEDEGEPITVERKIAENAARVKILNKPSAPSDALSGLVAHAGWIATKCSLPKWTGAPADAMALAPVEIELT